jgi:inorganic triphosphatase YgiF
LYNGLNIRVIENGIMSKELELKLGCLPTVAAQVCALPFLSDLPSESKLLLNLYYDTPDESLKRMKMALRIRKSGDQWLQTLKTTGITDASGLSTRGEYEWVIDGPNLKLDLLKELLPADLDSDSLYPVFSTNFKRTTWLYQREQTQIEIACDQGEVRTGNRIEPISEVELELKQGDASALFDLAEQLTRLSPLWIGQRSKAQRGWELRFEHPPAPELPSLIMERGDLAERVERLSAMTICWQRCYELIPITLAPTVITTLCSALEQQIALLRQLSDLEASAGLLKEYEALLTRVMPLYDLAYFSGSTPTFYKTIQERSRSISADLLNDPSIGQLALRTAHFIRETTQGAGDE